MLRCMGRKRATGKHLPWRMYRHGKGYRFVSPDGKKVPLGTVYAEALKRYADEVTAHRREGRVKTMADLFDRYQAEVVPTKAESTRATNLYELGKLRTVFGRMTPSGVRPKHIYGYMDSRGKPTRANREVALLSHVFTKAIRWGVVEANPCAGVERNKEEPSERYVDTEEFWNAFEVATSSGKVAMLLCASCGFRGSELRHLRWENCRKDGIHVQRGKKGKRQVLKYNPTVREALRLARERLRRGGVTVASPWVFPQRNGRQYTHSGLQSMWRRQKAPFTLRDLRAKSGSDHETGGHLGHQPGRTLSRHYRRRPEVVEVLDIPRGVEYSQTDSDHSR